MWNRVSRSEVPVDDAAGVEEVRRRRRPELAERVVEIHELGSAA